MRTAPVIILFFLLVSCRDGTIVSSDEILVETVRVNGKPVQDRSTVDSIEHRSIEIRIRFNAPVDTGLFNKNKVYFSQPADTSYYHSFTKTSDVLIVRPRTLRSLSLYRFTIDVGRNMGGLIREGFTCNLLTKLDTTPKFDIIPDDSLLSHVQKQTLRYFTDYAHPQSGMARERLGSGDIVTTGGTGFGIMAILTGIKRNFISRDAGFDQIERIVSFLNKSEKFHGAFPHWYNGSTGRAIAFSQKDNGGDIVETAFLVQGLLTARQFFREGSASEKALCDSITALWEKVEWDWYRNNNQNKLFWHWSPDYKWEMNMPVSGWNEALITCVLAASSPTHSISREVYDQGWARSGAYPMKNGEAFYGLVLPLGEDFGGPLFFSHYSFIGLDPRSLSDSYADYWQQNTAHSLINYRYCVANPKKRSYYGPSCWGLTASDIYNGYSASSPLNDLGVIAPTAAISSMPYTPAESMQALKFFYYVLGDRLWGEYGFYDSFDAGRPWFADSYLAIDQGPIVCMIENFRSGFLWDLFMSSDEVQKGLARIGFQF